MESSPILQLRGISKTFPPSKTTVVNQVSLELQQGELLGLLGPSGCGKTTLLRIVAGFEKVSQGQVVLAGNIVSDRNINIPPEKRNTGMVFQDYALFPHLTVAENIAFGLKGKKTEANGGIFHHGRLKNHEIQQRIRDVLELVGLSTLEKRYPHELSGGQQQRVALARAIAPQPALILLDEPLSNLDVQVRHRLREEIRAILKAAGTTAIFVTHDREEALAISDKIAVMRDGKLEQVGTPETIYTKPSSRFVAEFVTQANFLTARREGQNWTTEIGKVELPNAITTGECDRAELMLRQEDLLVTPDPDSNSLVTVKERQFLGREYCYCLETASGKRLHARTTIGNPVAVGTKVKVSVIRNTPLFFPFSSLNQGELESPKIPA
ncbi:MAG: ABC transporter ATP-binding protein [Xenococcus sp. MO_188.B8]|nr:ABC transporter ATP-binding protein [Xenococcus sp. MO_188.B8]